MSMRNENPILGVLHRVIHQACLLPFINEFI